MTPTTRAAGTPGRGHPLPPLRRAFASRRARLFARVLALAVIALAALGLGAAPAGAARYVVAACGDPATVGSAGQAVLSTQAWAPEGIVPPAGDYCANGASGAGMLAATWYGTAAYRFDAPAGTTLADAWTWYAARLPTALPWAFPRLVFDARHGTEWRSVWPARSGSIEHPTDLAESGVHSALDAADALRFGVSCDTPGCPADFAYVAVRSIAVAVDDPEAPAPAPLGGTFAAAGPLHGRRELVAAATDAGGGVAALSVSVAGRTVEAWRGCTPREQPFAGAPVYEQRVPCPPGARDTAVVDTAALADGPQRVEVRAEDAAGNARVAASQVVLDNHPPDPGNVAVSGPARSGARLIAVTTGFAGQEPSIAYTWEACTTVCRDVGTGDHHDLGTGDIGSRLRVRAVATDGGGSSTAYSALTDVVTPAPAPSGCPSRPRRCPSSPPPPAPVRGNGRGADRRARVEVWLEDSHGVQTRRLTVPPGVRARIRGRLVDRAGRPIAGAALGLVEYLAAGAHETTGVRTRADGRFTAFTRIGPSRTLRFTYRPFPDAAVIRGPLLRLFVRR